MTALSTPSMAMDFASMPPSFTCESTTSRSSGTTIAKTSGASVACATAADSGAATSGQMNAISPTAEASAIARRDEGPSRTARAVAGRRAAR